MSKYTDVQKNVPLLEPWYIYRAPQKLHRCNSLIVGQIGGNKKRPVK